MREHLVFYVNGARHQVADAAATLTLTDYLRDGADRLTGTKVACAEGDCGACTVLVGIPSANGDRLEYRTVDACIAFVFQMDRRHIVTVEGVGTPRELSDVQQAMVDCHGSQCGFCTPGFVMAIHGLLGEQSRESISEDDLRVGLSGNLCRCTGYQQILDACQAVDVVALPSVDDKFDSQAMLKEFAALDDESVVLSPSNGSPHATWVMLPDTLEDLLEFRQQCPSARLVAGATDLGVQHNHGKFIPREVIVTDNVSDFGEVTLADDKLVIGAGASWAKILGAVENRLPEYARILARFGSPQVRNLGTLVGNLANASPIADSIPFHMVAESTIEVASAKGERSIAINNFYLGYKQIDLKPDEVVTRVTTPLPSDNVRLKLYKISKRRDMDISTVTAAFWLEMDGDTIAQARVATGGVGPTVVRLPKAEAALVGKPLSLDTMATAGAIARMEVKPLTDVRGSADYRLQLVENLFVKCYYDLCSSDQHAETPA